MPQSNQCRGHDFRIRVLRINGVSRIGELRGTGHEAQAAAFQVAPDDVHPKVSGATGLEYVLQPERAEPNEGAGIG
ncbi:hypothetical protein D3C83_138230 [compost metagenome]